MINKSGSKRTGMKSNTAPQNVEKRSLKKNQTELEEFIIEKLAGFEHLPSQIATEFFGKEKMKQMMEPVRCACRRLHLADKIKITQGNKSIKTLNFRGSIRVTKSLKSSIL